MPCRVYSDTEERGMAYDKLREVQENLKDLEAILCGVFSVFDESCPGGGYYKSQGWPVIFLDGVLSAVDWEEAGVTREFAEKWWEKHKMSDQERKEREQMKALMEKYGVKAK